MKSYFKSGRGILSEDSFVLYSQVISIERQSIALRLLLYG